MIPTWNLERYVGQKKLRCGFTTGSAAAAAAHAAAWYLKTGEILEYVSLPTPKGIVIPVPVETIRREGASIVCGVRKDGGDDVDATDGLLIEVKLLPDPLVDGIMITGGLGIGTVTKPGLEQPVGQAAINRVPRMMIETQIKRVLGQDSLHLEVIVSVPEGVSAAKKTYNPYLGIVGGISILGTTGIVEPFSVEALIETISLDLSTHRAQGETRLLLTPGNYGSSFLEQSALANYQPVQCSNFIGESIDQAVRMGFEEILLVGHIGKLVKLAGGIMNTHSRQADCRAELFTAHAALAGADACTIARLMQSNTTDESLQILREVGLAEPVLQSLAKKAQQYLDRRAGDGVQIGICMMNLSDGLLVQSEEGRKLWNEWSKPSIEESSPALESDRAIRNF